MRTSKITYVSLLLSIISLLLCCYLLFSDKRFEADWGQIITGILSFLVTILIAWQIWTIIDTKNIIKELEKSNNAILLNSDLRYSQLSVSIFSSMFDFYKHEGNQVFEYFRYGLLVVKHSIAISDYGLSNVMIKGLIESFPTKPVTNANKAILLSLLHSIPSNDRLINFEELKSKILLMPSNDNV